MKQTYEKPRIFYESFALSDRISAGCEGVINLAEHQCPIYIKDLEYTIFSDNISCEVTAPGGDDDICYHAPTDNSNVYSS